MAALRCKKKPESLKANSSTSVAGAIVFAVGCSDSDSRCGKVLLDDAAANHPANKQMHN